MMKTLWLKIKGVWKKILMLFGIGVVSVVGIVSYTAVEVVKTNFELAQECIATPKKINECIDSLSAKERAKIKGIEIAKIGSVSKYRKINQYFDGYIEIVSFNSIEDGVEVLARVWDKDDKQIGFGKDGTVDIERFVFINPPILVDDPLGIIVREWTDERTGELKQRKLREDPKEAILQSLSHTISLIEKGKPRGKITSGKVGNTTLTAYPNAGTGTAPIDSILAQSGTDATWATLRGGAGNSNSNTTAEISIWNVRHGSATDTFNLIRRGGFGFTTSSIGTDNIDSATLSFWVTNKGVLGGDTDADVVDFNPAAGTITTFDNSDYANFGTTRFATGKTISSGISTAAYNNFTLNASGIANIDKSGNSYFGTRLKWDVDNTAPTSEVNKETFVDGYMADNAGTTNDPKLVVEHSAAVGGSKDSIWDDNL